MAALAHRLKEHETRALRDWVIGSGELDVYLHEADPRVFRDMHAVPPGVVVRIGKNERLPWSGVERSKLGLWPETYFKFGPSCRACGAKITDKEKAIRFAFSSDRRPDRWREAYIHFDPCGGGYAVEDQLGTVYALATVAPEAAARMLEARAYLDEAAYCGHPDAHDWADRRLPLKVRVISPVGREQRLANGTPVLDRER